MIRHIPRKYTSHARRGVTLTEVLMSMLIMSIGISFIAAVFPLSVLRTIQASQLTSATIHRFQAEALLDMFPDLVHNPEGIPLEGLDGVTGPGDINGDGQVDTDDDRPNTYREHFGRNYIVDPWAYYIHAQDGTVFDRFDPPSGSTFNNTLVSDWFGIDAGGVSYLQRYDGGIAAQTFPAPTGVTPEDWLAYREDLAATLTASTDRWEEVATTPLVTAIDDGNGNIIGVSFDAGIDLSMVDDPASGPNFGVVPDSELGRITIFDDHGHASQTYPITNAVGSDIYWSELAPGAGDADANGTLDRRYLPPRIDEIGHATIEISQKRQFSWMMTVRKRADGNAGVDVAVLFNRGIDAQLEYAYRTTFISGTNTVGIKYDPTSEPEPFLKKGGYILDAQNCRWYRIQDIRQQPTIGTWEFGDYQYVLSVEGTILSAGGEDISTPIPNDALDAGEDRNGNNTLDYGRAVLLPGVIEVYPLGTVAVPEEF